MLVHNLCAKARKFGTGKRNSSGKYDLPTSKKNMGWKKKNNSYIDEQGNVWTKDMKHKDHWDVSDAKGNRIREVDYKGNQISPNGPKNKNR